MGHNVSLMMTLFKVRIEKHAQNELYILDFYISKSDAISISLVNKKSGNYFGRFCRQIIN